MSDENANLLYKISTKYKSANDYNWIFYFHLSVVFSLYYSIALKNKYPLPLIEVNKALGYISKYHQRYFADKDFIVLAGNSAGSRISAQVANIITNAEYSNIMKIHPGLDKALNGFSQLKNSSLAFLFIQ